MQDGDIPSIEFHKVLQEVEKYCNLKADIRNQAKTKVTQITKEQREELLQQGRRFFAKNHKYFRYPGCKCQSMKHLHITACNFCISHELLIIYFFLDYLLLPKFIQALHRYGAICTKNNLLILDNGILMAFSGSCFAFRQFRRAIFNSFAYSNNVVMFIYFFVTPKQVTKIFFSVHVSFCTSKYPSSSELLKMLHCWLSASADLHSSTYT